MELPKWKNLKERFGSVRSASERKVEASKNARSGMLRSESEQFESELSDSGRFENCRSEIERSDSGRPENEGSEIERS